MKKAERLAELLDSCGDELFSALMNGSIQRSAGLDRLLMLFEYLSDRIFLPKSTSGAYRLMVRRAAKLGWAPGEPSDSHALTFKEQERTEKKLREYLASGGRRGKLVRKAVTGAAVLTAAGLGVFFTARWVTSEEYLSRLTEYGIMIADTERSEKEIVFEIRLRDEEDMYLERMPVLKLTDKDGEWTFSAKPSAEFAFRDEKALCTSKVRELILRSEDYDRGYDFLPGHYEVTFDFCRYSEDEKTEIASITKEVEI